MINFIVAFISLLLIPMLSWSQSLTLDETFGSTNQCWSASDKTIDEVWLDNGGCYSYSYCVVDDPCGGGNKVMRFRVIIGDDNGACPAGAWKNLSGSAGCTGPSPYFQYKHRTEIIESKAAGGDNRPDIGQNFWTGFRIYIPSDFPNPNRLQPTIMQIIDADGAADGTDWALRARDTTFEADQRTTLENGSASNGHSISTIQPMTRGAWHNFVLHYNRETTATGRTRLWMNGVLQQDYSGRTAAATTPDVWWKFGLYRGCLSQSYSGTYDIYFDDIKAAYGNSDSQDLSTLVGPTAAAGACASGGTDPPSGGPITEESCTVSQQAGTNGLIIVPDDQANLETAVETNTSKTILVKQGTYTVNNFQIGAGNIVKPYNCGAVDVVMNGTADNTITADNWTIAGMRFFCRGLDRDCFAMTTADNWTMRNNHITEIMRGGPHVRGDSTGGLLEGNTFESCPSCVQGNMVTVGSILDPGGVGCTGEPCLYGNSPSNVTIRNNRFTSAVSPSNIASGGNHMLAIDGYSRLGLEIYDNVFTNPHNFWSAISFTNNWLRPGNALNGSAHVHHNTIYGPFTGQAASTGPSGPAIYLQDATGCKAANDCPNHRIHHNYIRNSYSYPSIDGRRLSGGFKGHSSRYATATIEHNIDDNDNNVDDRETEAVHGMIFRQNTFFTSAMRFQNEICTDTHTGDNFTFTKNAVYNTEIVDSCTGTPDWLISDNVISPGPSTFAAGHLDSGNTTTTIAFGNVTQDSEDFTITTAAEAQKGALPAPVISSATIGTDCVLNINMTPFNANGHDHGPISRFYPIKLTVKYDGVAQTITAGNIATNNVLKASMSSCPDGADTVTFDATYGWCLDSANIGGVEKQMHARCVAVTGQSVTNTASGGPPPAPTTFYIDASCGVNGNGTTATCSATGPWNSVKAALETAACAGMEPGNILEVKGEAALDLTCEGAGTNCYFEDNVQVAQNCSGIIIQNAANEHAIIDGTVDIKGSTWTSVGSGVYQCSTSGCAGDLGDVFAFKAWYNRGAGAEELTLVQSNQVCDATLAAGFMRINPTTQSICVHLSNGSSPASASYFRIPWYTPALNGTVGDATNVTFRSNPSGTGSFRIQRYRNNGIELDALSNAGWVIDGMTISNVMSRCISVASEPGTAGIKITDNTISFCGEEGINLTGDLGAFEISGNTITDIQTTPTFELCSGVGTGCLSGMETVSRGIRIEDHVGTGSVISGNTLLRIGGGFNGRARGINLHDETRNISIRNNYIAHMSNLPLLGSGIILSGVSAGQYNNGNVIYNNRVYDTDICFYWLYNTDYSSQSGTTNYLLNNTCAEPLEFGLFASWGNNALLDGNVVVQNNIFSSTGASYPTLLANIAPDRSTGWTVAQNNAFECDNCDITSPCEDEGGCPDERAVVDWRGTKFSASDHCQSGTNCVADMSTLGSGFTANVYGDVNVNLTGGTEPDLHIASPSVAHDAGRTVTQVMTDYLGTVRPRGSAFDAGAYELAGSTTFSLTQKSFRFFAPRSEDGMSPMAAENTNVSVFLSSAFSLRFAVTASAGDAPPIDLAVWARKCNPSCGAWTLVDGSSSAAVGVYILNNPVRGTLEPISNQLTLGGNVFDTASKSIDALPNAITSAIITNYQFEAEYHLGVSSGVAIGDTVELRIERPDGTDLNTYTATPVITLSKARGKHKGKKWR